MNKSELYLNIARDEINTISQYKGMLDTISDLDEHDKEIVDEIISDEFNHALIAVIMAANCMNVKIADDNLSKNPNTIDVEINKDGDK